MADQLVVKYKDPNARLDYVFELADYLDPLNDSLTDDIDVLVPQGLTREPPTHDGENIVVWIPGGSLKGRHRVTAVFATSGGRVDRRSFLLVVGDM